MVVFFFRIRNVIGSVFVIRSSLEGAGGQGKGALAPSFIFETYNMDFFVLFFVFL